jgi:hypothetical protein
MRGLFGNATILAGAAMLWSGFGMAQDRPVVAVAANGPNTRTLMDQAPGYQGGRAKRAMNRAPNERARNPSLEPPGRSQFIDNGVVETRAAEEAAAMLRPTWDRGFWVLPPGGLTRFLIPSRAIINVDGAPVQAKASEACAPP